MKRWLTNLFIATYVTALGYGLFAHFVGFEVYSNIGMYYIVWDMFSGWDAFENRQHLIAEGESGQFYDVSPPWTTLHPFGADARHHYDHHSVYGGITAKNVLRNTDHEPIVRIIAVDEVWSKKYNLPESLWNRHFEEPRQKRSYYYIRTVFQPDGAITQRHIGWTPHLGFQAIMDNPRLRKDMSNSRPYITTDSFSRETPNRIQQVGFLAPVESTTR